MATKKDDEAVQIEENAIPVVDTTVVEEAAPQEAENTETPVEETQTEPEASAEDTAPAEDEVAAEDVDSDEDASENEDTESSEDVSTIPQGNVSITSDDGRNLYVNFLGISYTGVEIEVPAEHEGEIRRILTDGGFVLK